MAYMENLKNSLPELNLTGKEEVEYDENGVPRRFLLSQDTYWRGILFKSKTYLTVSNEGLVEQGTSAIKQRIQVGYNLFMYEENTRLIFYQNGNLQSGTIAENINVSGLPMNVGKGQISFFESGAINTCIASEPIKIYGRNTTANTRIILSDYIQTDKSDQLIREAFFTEQTRWGEHIAAAETSVGFHDGKTFLTPGEIRYYTTSGDVLIQNLLAKKGKILSLYENGSVRFLSLAIDLTHFNIDLKVNQTDLFFYSNKNFQKINSSHEVIVEGKTFAPWRGPTFDVDGNLTNEPY